MGVRFFSYFGFLIILDSSPKDRITYYKDSQIEFDPIHLIVEPIDDV